MQNVKIPPSLAEDTQLSDLFVSRLAGDFSNNQRISTVHLLELLEEGVNGSVLKPLTTYIPRTVVVKVVGSDQTNFSKLIRRKRLTSKQTEELNDLTEFWQELRVFFDGDENSINEWINNPVPALSGATPVSLMGGLFGRKKVRECLDVMKFGDIG